MPPTRVPLILGASTFGNPEAVPPRTEIQDIDVCQRMVDIFVVEHGQKYIDTSRAYGGGASEEFLSKLVLHIHDEAIVDTKVHARAMGNLKADSIRKSLLQSIQVLGKKIRVFYFHIPDRTTPLEESLKAVNDLYQEGHFEEFGLSNYAAFEVAQIWTICKERGYVLPTVYQGPYNLVQRGCEAELFPALRAYNIRFAAWSPLAGGLLSGNVSSKDAPLERGSRYDPDTGVGKLMRRLFLSGTEIEAVQYLGDILNKYNLTPNEVALRWLQHHSQLTPDDYVVIGNSKPEHTKSNCADSEKGPLPDEVVQACEAVWLMVKAKAHPYYLPFDFVMP